MSFKLFKSKVSIPFKVEEGHVIEPVFHDGIEQYYQLKDVFNTFCARAMDALAVYEQWQMRCTGDFLKLHTKAVKEILYNPKKVNIPDVAKLNDLLIERLEWAMPTEEIIYNFAAVAYFDRHESPYKYDNNYGKEKIKRWKTNKKIDNFFLFSHSKDLIPSPDFSKADLSLLTEMIGKMDQKHLQLISGMLPSNQARTGSNSKQQSEKSLA